MAAFLQPDASSNQRGLWRAKDGYEQGVHALIAGISAYPHLAKGTDPAPEVPSAFGQLAVSAKTAARLFDWLNQSGRLGGAPVSSCRLLLSPVDEEIAEVDQLTSGHYGDPTFKVFKESMEAWADDLFNAGASNEAVAFLAVSGHGFEWKGSPAFLTKDILKPNSRNRTNAAIALNELPDALRTFGIKRGYCLIDACRNAPNFAKRLDIKGTTILEPVDSGFKRPEVLLMQFSTEANAFSYQIPTAPATVFGEAVLEALDGVPPDYKPYDTSLTPWSLIANTFDAYVNRRSQEILSGYSANAVQAVETYGYPYSQTALVADREPETAPVDPPRQPVAAPPPDDDLVELVAMGAVSEELKTTIQETTSQIISNYKHVDLRVPEPVGRAIRSPLKDEAIMHGVFGHESVTEPFVKSVKAYDLATGRVFNLNRLITKGAYSSEGQGGINVWIDLEVFPGEGALLFQVKSSRDSSSYLGVVVPRDKELAIPIRLDLFASPPGEDHVWRFTSFTARLGPSEEHGTAWSKLWQIQRIGLLSDRASAADAMKGSEMLQDLVYRKIESPVAAALAATIIVEAGSDELISDWPKNIANWFKAYPEGPVLWSEILLRVAERQLNESRKPHKYRKGKTTRRQAQEDRAQYLLDLAGTKEGKEAREYFHRLEKVGAPTLASTLQIAIRQARFWREVQAAEIELGSTTYKGSFFARGERAFENIDRISELVRPGGVFTSLSFGVSIVRALEVNMKGSAGLVRKIR